MEAHLSSLSGLVLEEHRHVSCKWYSMTCGEPYAITRNILKAFAEEHAASVYVRYFVGGICRKSQQRVAVVVGQEKLQGVLDTLHTVHSTHVCSVSPCKPASDYDLYNPNGEKALQSIVQNLPDAVASFQEFACAVVRCGPPLNTTPVSSLTSTPLSLPPLFHQVAAP